MTEDKSKKLENLLERGVDEIIDKESLLRKINSRKKLRIKLGIDPTSPNLHLGRSVPLLKMRDFQELGHKLVFIIGDFTGLIGDTSDKESERPMLSEKEVKANLKTYIKQVSKIIDIDKAEIYHNSKWLKKLGFAEIGMQANIFSVNEFISRENIKKRLDDGKRVSLREVLYPLMQGYDSVAVKADVELGGIDQRFNLLAGRDVQRMYEQEPQDIITGPLVEGLDGRKMSSSWGNTINLLDSPDEMFGKVMSIKDELIVRYFTLLTRVDMEEVRGYEKELEKGINPRDVKMKLAHEIVRMYHDDKKAGKAEENWEKTFSQGEIPADISEVKAKEGEVLLDILVSEKVIESKTQARRLFEEGAVKDMETGEKVADTQTKILKSLTLKVGKKVFVKVVI